jgi:hypothetical protein
VRVSFGFVVPARALAAVLRIFGFWAVVLRAAPFGRVVFFERPFVVRVVLLRGRFIAAS